MLVAFARNGNKLKKTNSKKKTKKKQEKKKHKKHKQQREGERNQCKSQQALKVKANYFLN